MEMQYAAHNGERRDFRVQIRSLYAVQVGAMFGKYCNGYPTSGTILCVSNLVYMHYVTGI